jgi:flagellar basal-body rod protein FlgF/flagellar basal-body rod protein FlgG
MDSGFYAAYSGLLARTEALDSAASNLANSSTTGFRAEREYFKGVIAGSDASESQMGSTINNYGVLGGNRLDFGQGALSSTGNTLDVGIQGRGFFSVLTSSGVLYTRDGSFQRGNDGTLETQTGDAVLNPLGKTILLPVGEITVGRDGAISVDGGITGQIGLFDFRPQDLAPEGTNRYRNLGSAPRLAIGSSIRQRFLESSNQDVIQGSLQLLLVQRQAEMMQKALTIFQGSFDKPASEDLPKV